MGVPPTCDATRLEYAQVPAVKATPFLSARGMAAGRSQAGGASACFVVGVVPGPGNRRIERPPGLQNFGTRSDTTPGIVSEAPFTVLDLAHWATDP